MLYSQVEISTRQLDKRLEVFGKVGAAKIIITELEFQFRVGGMML